MKTEYPFYDIENEFETVKDVVYFVQKAFADNPVFRYKEGGNIVDKSKQDFIRDLELVQNFYHIRFGKGSHIAVLGKTSYEWVVSHFAVMCSENVAVPLDKELPAEELVELIKFADAECLVFDKDYVGVAKQVREVLGISCICMQDAEGFENMPNLLEQMDKSALWTGNPEPDDIAEIVFTSGTTGKSKGVMLTHKNLAWNAMNARSYVYLTNQYSTMSILPINHTLENSVGMLAPFANGVTICINDSLKYITRNLQVYRPECMIAVPLVVETFYKTIWREIEKQGKASLIKVAMFFAGLLYKCHIDVRRKIFAQILNQLGGNFRLLVVGGAFLETQMIKDFETWGIDVVQGYGITECAPVVTCNTDRYKKYASVGKVVNGCEVKIVDGEVWVKGPIVMKGYYKNAEATSEVFDGKWFKTGDLGYLDKDNFLYLTGRRKNLIILPNGENVSPEELEQKIMRIPYVKEVVVSEADGMILAEVFLDKETEPDAENKIQGDINLLNKTLPNYKKIAKTVVREQEFEKTTSRKIKRNK